MIIPTEQWTQCLKCPHCYDDDEALYCAKQDECKLKEE